MGPVVKSVGQIVFEQVNPGRSTGSFDDPWILVSVGNVAAPWRSGNWLTHLDWSMTGLHKNTGPRDGAEKACGLLFMARTKVVWRQGQADILRSPSKWLSL